MSLPVRVVLTPPRRVVRPLLPLTLLSRGRFIMPLLWLKMQAAGKVTTPSVNPLVLSLEVKQTPWQSVFAALSSPPVVLTFRRPLLSALAPTLTILLFRVPIPLPRVPRLLNLLM